MVDVGTVLAATGVSSIVTFALQKSFEHRLNKKAAEHQIRYAKLHEKVAEVVAGTYARLQKMRFAIEGYVSEFSPPPLSADGQYRNVRKAVRNFLIYFAPRRLYFSKALADEISAFKAKMVRLVRDYGVYVERGDKKPGDDTWGKISDAFHDDGTKLFESLEKEFRKLLGVEEPKSRKRWFSGCRRKPNKDVPEKPHMRVSP